MRDPGVLLAAYDEHFRPAEWKNLEEGAWAEPDGPIVRIVGRQRGFVSTPRDLGVSGADLDALIARQRDFFAARGEGVEWKTRGHDLPADLPDRLKAAGFQPDDQETVEIGIAAEHAVEPAMPEGVHIRLTTDDADMYRIGEMQSEVWSMDLGWLAESLISRKDTNTVFVAEANGRIVSAAWLAYRGASEFGYLAGGSTRAEWRGRGIYRALVAHRARVAVDLGIKYLQVDASDDSRPILERLGFIPVTTTTPYMWNPPS